MQLSQLTFAGCPVSGGTFSGRGVIPHRRYVCKNEPASARLIAGVSRSGAMPEPTVIVRMKENVHVTPQLWGDAMYVIALGAVSGPKGDYDDTKKCKTKIYSKNR